MKIRVSGTFSCCFASVALASCSGGSGSPVAPLQGPSPTPTPVVTAKPTAAPSATAAPTATPNNLMGAFTPGPAVSPFNVASAQHLYIGTYSGSTTPVSGSVLELSEPLTPASTALPVGSSYPAYAVTVDPSGRLLAGEIANNGESIADYSSPVTSAGSPQFRFDAGLNIMAMAVDGSGDLITTDEFGQTDFLTPPFAPGSFPVHYFQAGYSAIAAVGSRVFAGATNKEFVYDPPYVSFTSNVSMLGFPLGAEAISSQIPDGSGNLIVATQEVGNGPSFPGTILVYPQASIVGNSASPTVALPLPQSTNGPIGGGVLALALDSSGRLVVSADYCPQPCTTPSGAELLVYNLPLTSTSAPAFTITLPGYGALATMISGS